MCGIFAAFGQQNLSDSALRKALDVLAPRGPDGESVYRSAGVLLAHRRLAVIDLNDRAIQPMYSACGRYIIVYNGEIYNYRELRRELEVAGTRFRTTSDTEVVLELYSSLGSTMLHRLSGMFAFVIWDHLKKCAFAARDPYGIKPLYFARVGGGVIFSSQVRALLATGLTSREPNIRGQVGFWMLGSTPEPNTWYRDIFALASGHSVTVTDSVASEPVCWHDIGSAWRNSGKSVGRVEDTKAAVALAVRQSIERHLVSDVPVGVFLSGGIDSGSLAGLMAEFCTGKVTGITIAYGYFDGTHDDEAPPAASIAAYYGIDHHVRCVTQREFLDDLPLILSAMDQPTIDGINIWYASKAASEQGLKVVISGLGGDELFLGYRSFSRLPHLVQRWQLIRTVPGLQALGRALGKIQARRTKNLRWCHAWDWMSSIAGAWWLSRSVNSPEVVEAIMPLSFSDCTDGHFNPNSWLSDTTGALSTNPVLALAQLESVNYMRNQLLRDCDWASMDHSVEIRTPLVDTALLSSLTPYLSLFQRFPFKTLLADTPAQPLPREIVYRPKTGFGIPVKKWVGEHFAVNTQLDWMRQIVSAYETSH